MRGTFEIDPNNPHVIFLRRLFRGGALVAAIPSLVLFAFGDKLGALIWLAFPIAMATVIAWSWGGIGRGSAIVDGTGIKYVTRVSSFSFPWAHVKGARLANVSEAFALDQVLRRVLRIPSDYRYVLLELDRWIHQKTFGRGAGTDVSGIPMFTYQHACYVKDPDAFLAEVNMWLDAYHGLDSTTRSSPWGAA